MQFPKSTPDLNQGPKRRNSRNLNNQQRNSKQWRADEFKIENPFKCPQQGDKIPLNILSQIQQLQYISPKSIKNIEVPQCRRVSGMMKNLQMMQQLAKKQEQKFTGLIQEGYKAQDSRHVQFRNQTTAINMIDQDRASIQLNGFYDYRERIDEDFNIFDNQDNGMMQDAVAFYSNGEIQAYRLQEQLNNYLD